MSAYEKTKSSKKNSLNNSDGHSHNTERIVFNGIITKDTNTLKKTDTEFLQKTEDTENLLVNNSNIVKETKNFKIEKNVFESPLFRYSPNMFFYPDSKNNSVVIKPFSLESKKPTDTSLGKRNVNEIVTSFETVKKLKTTDKSTIYLNSEALSYQSPTNKSSQNQSPIKMFNSNVFDSPKNRNKLLKEDKLKQTCNFINSITQPLASPNDILFPLMKNDTPIIDSKAFQYSVTGFSPFPFKTPMNIQYTNKAQRKKSSKDNIKQNTTFQIPSLELENTKYLSTVRSMMHSQIVNAYLPKKIYYPLKE